MNKKTLALTLGSTMVTVLTASQLVHAQENPFKLQKIGGSEVVAATDEKMPEGFDSTGKMGEGKCGANKDKMKEAGNNSAAKPEDKMQEGKCGANKDKMKEGKASSGSDKM